MAAAFYLYRLRALRLARFNISTAAVGKRFFIGLPIPAAGCTLVTFVFFAALFPDGIRPAFAVFGPGAGRGRGRVDGQPGRAIFFQGIRLPAPAPIRAMLGFLLVLGTVISAPRTMGFVLQRRLHRRRPHLHLCDSARRNRQLLRALSPQSD